MIKTLLCLVVLVLLPPDCLGDETKSSSNAEHILHNIISHKATVAGKQAAIHLSRQGDSAYKQKNYDLAYSAYSNSYPNHPTAYAYIMSGDAYWRSFVHFNVRQPSETNTCQINNLHFPSDLQLNLAQHYQVGLNLAILKNEKKLLSSSIYRHADETMQCLRKLLDFYKSEPAESCVDVTKISVCLGEPLIK